MTWAITPKQPYTSPLNAAFNALQCPHRFTTTGNASRFNALGTPHRFYTIGKPHTFKATPCKT